MDNLPVQSTTCVPVRATAPTAARTATLMPSCARRWLSDAACNVPSMSSTTMSGRPAAKLVTTQ
jgi:hypothetical protein